MRVASFFQSYVGPYMPVGFVVLSKSFDEGPRLVLHISGRFCAATDFRLKANIRCNVIFDDSSAADVTEMFIDVGPFHRGCRTYMYISTCVYARAVP